MPKSRVDYSEYLDVPMEDIEEPLPPPMGHYLAVIKPHRTQDIDYNQGDGPAPHITIPFALKEPLEDVDLDLIPKGGIKGKLVSKNYRLDDGTGQAAIRKLAEQELKLPTKGFKLSDILRDHLPNQEVVIFIDHRAGKGEREGQMFANVKKVMGPDAVVEA